MDRLPASTSTSRFDLRRTVLRTLVAAVLPTFAGLANAQPAAFPTRNVTIIVPFPAGATLDFLVRQVAQQLAERWKHSVVVDNRTGAGGIVGISYGAKAPNDGYTLTAVANSFVANTVLRNDMPYDAFADFAPVTLLGAVPHVLVAGSGAPFKTIAELQRYGKDKTSMLSYSSGGNGTMSHLAGEMLKRSAGINAVHVPYRGQGPALADVVSGQVHLTFANLPEALPMIKEGRIRALAIAQHARSQLLPDVPTFAEVGMPTVISDSWYGLVAPKGTSPEIVARIQRDIASVMAQPEMRSKLLATGLEPAAPTPKAFEDFMRSTAQAYRRVITDAHITLDK
jgi:tripartite-type tricarboxylate transporter receptor subunit TctC